MAAVHARCRKAGSTAQASGCQALGVTFDGALEDQGRFPCGLVPQWGIQTLVAAGRTSGDARQACGKQEVILVGPRRV